MLENVLQEYGLAGSSVSIQPLHKGLINHTWIISRGEEDFVLQQLNEKVFNRPEVIAANISLLANYVREHKPEYFFVSPVYSRKGVSMMYEPEQGYFRLFPFVTGSHTKDTVSSSSQAYEAAKQFGRFTHVFKGMDISGLGITIASFHDLSLRYRQLQNALETGNDERISASAGLVKSLMDLSWIVKEYEQIRNNPAFRVRVTHHDTKISNVLFDNQDKGICVIDLDTVMPGYFISDVGDMMRTYLSPVSEEEQDFSKIEIRTGYYQAVVQGYFEEMKEELTPQEIEHFFYAGVFMIYMQAIRFITDYINHDQYYGAKYPQHNYVRARNQLVLLQRLFEKEAYLAKQVEHFK